MKIAYYVNTLSGSSASNAYIILEDGYEWHERHISNFDPGIVLFPSSMYQEFIRDTDIPWFGWVYWDGDIHVIATESFTDGSDYPDFYIDYPAIHKLHRYLLTKHNPLLVWLLSFLLASVFLPYVDQSIHTYLRQKVKKLIDAIPDSTT
jgi:hypothetical protein